MNLKQEIAVEQLRMDFELARQRNARNSVKMTCWRARPSLKLTEGARWRWNDGAPKNWPSASPYKSTLLWCGAADGSDALRERVHSVQGTVPSPQAEVIISKGHGSKAVVRGEPNGWTVHCQHRYVSEDVYSLTDRAF
jgi:hypothetical protein